MTNPTNRSELPDSHYRWRYALLTIVLVIPLVWSFVEVRSVYPVSAWTVMISGGSLQQPWTYYLVRGETVTGELIDLRPAEITDALYGRTWSLVRAAVNNDAFNIQSPHPRNLELLNSDSELLPGAQVPELLTIWARLYNANLPSHSPFRLRAVRLDVYRWESGRFQDYGKFVATWRADL